MNAGRANAGGPSFGIVSGADLAEVRWLEEAGVDSIWTGGHIASDNPSPEPLISLARISAVTQRVQIGTAVLLLALYEPAIVAKQIADLDRSCGGRIVLGVGVGGEYPAEFRACHVPLSGRGRRTDEAIGLLRRYWTAGPITWDGPVYQVSDVRIHPPPSQEGGPAIVIGGRGHAAVRRAAILGNGWMPYLVSPRRYAASVHEVRTVAEAAGRPLDHFAWYVFVFVNVNPDGHRAHEDLAAALGGTYRRDVRPMVDHVAAAGTSREVAAALAAYMAAGATHLVLAPMTVSSDRRLQLERIVGEVVPAVRERVSGSALPG